MRKRTMCRKEVECLESKDYVVTDCGWKGSGGWQWQLHLIRLGCSDRKRMANNLLVTTLARLRIQNVWDCLRKDENVVVMVVWRIIPVMVRLSSLGVAKWEKELRARDVRSEERENVLLRITWNRLLLCEIV